MRGGPVAVVLITCVSSRSVVRWLLLLQGGPVKKEEEPAKLPAPAQQQAQPPPAQQLSGADELVQLDRAIEEASAYGWVRQTDRQQPRL